MKKIHFLHKLFSLKGWAAIALLVFSGAAAMGCYTVPSMPEEVDFTLSARFTEFEDKVLTVDIGPDGRYLAAGGKDNTVKIYDLYTNSMVRELKRHPDDVFTLTFSPDGNLLATGCRDRILRIFDAGTGELIYSLDRHNSTIYDIAFHPSGRFVVSSGNDNVLYAWDLETGELVEILRHHTDAVYALQFTDDGKTLYTGSLDKTVAVWDTETRSMTDNFSVKQEVYTMAVDPGNTLLAVSGVTRIRGGAPGKKTSPIQVYSLADTEYKRSKAFSGHQPACWSMTFTPDGKYLISGGSDARIRIWNMQSSLQNLVGSFDSQAGEIWSIALSPKGDFLAAACSDNKVMVYKR